jgi:KaiC/GvpD/RAD55 family RecA-like ATPase
MLRSEKLDAAPTWVIDLLKANRGKRREHASKAPLAELDRPEAVKKAIEWLQQQAPEAVEGDGGDQTTYRVAARLRDMGLSPDTAFYALAEHWNEAGKASPPWPADQLREKVDNAFAYATGAWGGALGVAEFEDTTAAVGNPIAAPKRPRLYAVTFREALDLALSAAPPSLIRGLLDQQASAVVYGPSNSGKTFVVLDMALSVAASVPWAGRETASGLVVYVSAEGGRNMFKRLAAWHKAHPGHEDAPFVVVPCPINLRDGKADVPALVNLIHEQESAFGQRAVLVVIDTLARALAGGDENSSVDMGALVANVDRVREAVKATCILVHHTGKDASRGGRGWSGLLGAIDTEIEVEPGGHMAGIMRNTKQRDMAKAPDMNFRLETVEVGATADGERISSNVVRVVSGSEFLKLELTGRASELRDAFIDAAQEKAGATGRWRETRVSWLEWKSTYVGNLSPELEKIGGEAAQRTVARRGASDSVLRKLRAEVLASAQIVKVEEDQYVMG